MASIGKWIWNIAKRFHLLVGAIVFAALAFALYLGHLLLEDYLLSLIKTANDQHHWDFYTKFMYIVTTYPVRSSIVITCIFLIGSELHLRAKSQPLWKDIFGVDVDSTGRKNGKVPDSANIPDVELVPSRLQGKEQFLEVINKGKKQRFNAQCRILERRNDPNPTPHVLLDLSWWMRPSRKVEIASDESCNLLIGEAGDFKNKDG